MQRLRRVVFWSLSSQPTSLSAFGATDIPVTEMELDNTLLLDSVKKSKARFVSDCASYLQVGTFADSCDIKACCLTVLAVATGSSSVEPDCASYLQVRALMYVAFMSNVPCVVLMVFVSLMGVGIRQRLRAALAAATGSFNGFSR